MPEAFVATLAAYRRCAVFNPWGERDPQNDRDLDGPLVRRRQLLAYLQERIGAARILLVAEAIGYQGGHFSGIPMTSERLLLGGLQHKDIFPADVFRRAPQRTSSPKIKPEGFTEPTATIVWGLLKSLGIDPRSVVLWNAFPWHPYQLQKGLLSNRTPSDEELVDGHGVLRLLLSLGGFKTLVAVGRKSAIQLAGLGLDAAEVRHPANGGAGKFREQMSGILRGL
ncbi:uracil-DNA glycosylase [Geopsychrobacter electrodiphilus]|uniref:uracil-DNA glycosylase n=1 Tax=Geopsychrobacter electrodiphilus TaxID=225196 RepID=UPI00036A450F|nr:uracil-DNA glycosylase [Geopsychrobacter electrodiphilus]